MTVLELGGMFAAPFGATVLADLGARVIKVEPLEGDTIRAIMAFPEAGGGKVLQGKESIALDLRTPEGLAITHEIARRCDVVLQCYRAGVAARIGIAEAALKAVNPALVYLNAPGYGIDGPYGGKPAYAPSIGAAVTDNLGRLGLIALGRGDSATIVVTALGAAFCRAAGISRMPQAGE